MNIIKRDGKVQEFNKDKIYDAIIKSMTYGSGVVRKATAQKVADKAEQKFCKDAYINPTVRSIETFVYHELVNQGAVDTAKAYEAYRAVQDFKRQVNTTDESILTLVRGSNEEVMKENSNKNGTIASTQRDLMAGEVSKDIARRKLIPAHIVQAHDEGAIHWHK